MTIKHVGFTGTQEGMTRSQKDTLQREFLSLDFEQQAYWWFHHGDCIGADEEADAIARAFGAYVWLHPPVNLLKRAFVGLRPKIDRSADTRPYLQRNMDIVKASDWLFATPKGEEVTRSGTWSTVRLARNLGKPHTIIMPDGSIM